jgi:hypothetical protein
MGTTSAEQRPDYPPEKIGKDRPMKQQTLHAVAVDLYEVLSIEQAGAWRAGSELPDRPVPAVRPRQVVTADWRCTEDGRLEMRWLPTTPDAA